MGLVKQKSEDDSREYRTECTSGCKFVRASRPNRDNEYPCPRSTLLSLYKPPAVSPLKDFKMKGTATREGPVNIGLIATHPQVAVLFLA